MEALRFELSLAHCICACRSNRDNGDGRGEDETRHFSILDNVYSGALGSLFDMKWPFHRTVSAKYHSRVLPHGEGYAHFDVILHDFKTIGLGRNVSPAYVELARGVARQNRELFGNTGKYATLELYYYRLKCSRTTLPASCPLRKSCYHLTALAAGLINLVYFVCQRCHGGAPLFKERSCATLTPIIACILLSCSEILQRGSYDATYKILC